MRHADNAVAGPAHTPRPQMAPPHRPFRRSRGAPEEASKDSVSRVAHMPVDMHARRPPGATAVSGGLTAVRPGPVPPQPRSTAMADPAARLGARVERAHHRASPCAAPSTRPLRLGRLCWRMVPLAARVLDSRAPACATLSGTGGPCRRSVAPHRSTSDTGQSAVARWGTWAAPPNRLMRADRG
jgi:hypothetical protein